MKTIVRVGTALDSRERIADAKLAPLATGMLVDAFNRRRGEFTEAVLIVDRPSNGGEPVYIIVSHQPPEIAAGDRQVTAVFSPPESQEPLATFHDAARATAWAEQLCRDDGYITRCIDSTDRVTTNVCVGLIVKKPGTEQTLYCRLAKQKQWTIPEGALGLGESADSAARRIARDQLGIEITQTMIPGRVPYVNAYIEGYGHYVTLLLIAECVDDAKITKSDLYDLVAWAPTASPPEPHFLTLSVVKKAVSITAPAPPSKLKQPVRARGKRRRG